MASITAPTEQAWYKNYFLHEYLPSQIAIDTYILRENK